MDLRYIVFDLDGTLYEDERIYDCFAQELSRALPAAQRRAYLADWEAAKAGNTPARAGMGYDAAQDRLFRYEGRRITAYVDWDGREELVAAPPESEDLAQAHPEGGAPPIEIPIFGHDRFNIGDWWALPDIMARHYGVTREERQRAFDATRTYMHGDAFHLQPPPGQREMLERLLEAGLDLIAMSNSPAWSVDLVFDELGVRGCFSAIVADAGKPAGLARYLEGMSDPDRALSIGDNFVNDIVPALEAGSHALYIDRHGTGLGAGHPHCERVSSLKEAQEWVVQSVAAGA